MKWGDWNAGPEEWHLVPSKPPRRDGVDLADDVLDEVGVDLEEWR